MFFVVFGSEPHPSTYSGNIIAASSVAANEDVAVCDILRLEVPFWNLNLEVTICDLQI